MNAQLFNTPAPPTGPLAGLGVIITRPVRQAALFAQKLGLLGARPIIFPAILIEPPTDRTSLDAALRHLAEYDGVFFVSANAVEYGLPQELTWPANVAAYAPGPGTAAVLIDMGVGAVRYPPDDYASEGLLALPTLQQVKGQRFAIFRGNGGRELLGDTLVARGATVDHVTCYHRAAPSGNAEGLAALLQRGEAHALTLTSSEGVRNLWHVLDAPSRTHMQALPTFTAHPRVSTAARECGLAVHETGAGDTGLISGLLEWFAQHPLPSKARS